MSLKQRLEGGSSEEQLTCCSIPTIKRRSSRALNMRRSSLNGSRTSGLGSSSSSSSSSSGSSARVNIIFPDGQQHFASLLRLYLERRGASVSLMGEGVTGGGMCSRQLVLLPINENQRDGFAAWLGELARAASRRSSKMVAVVEERGQWRKTDP